MESLELRGSLVRHLDIDLLDPDQPGSQPAEEQFRARREVEGDGSPVATGGVTAPRPVM